MIIYAQAQTKRSCGTMNVHERLMETSPEYRANQKMIDEHNHRFEVSGHKTQSVITIPVVVHVVYRTSTENVSDAQIQSQIDVLNADYRKLNADITKVPSAFASVAADCQIQFCLAKRDPNGAATNGITRTQTTKTAFSDDDQVKSSATGGKTPWNTAQYLNLWVCNLGSELLGYAQFPGGPTTTDGVVVNYICFGTTGTAVAPFNKGRTATHEVGHWLNLRHIWGDGTCATDYVSDTPTQSAPNYACPTHPKVSCSNSGDMFMNYMDYTDDACMYMFSSGQSTRMNAVLASGGSRYSLVSSLGCVPPSTTTCSTASGLAVTSITASSATLNWTAVSTATNYNVRIKSTSSSTWTTLTASTNSLGVINLTASTTYEFQVQAICASNSASYSSSKSFTTSASSACATDASESNNTRSTATSISTSTAYSRYICPSTDVDWFKVSTTTTYKNLKVTLTNLPADFDIDLYNSSGTYLKQSANGGTTSETIIYNASAAATYYVKVYGYNSAYSGTTAYKLTAYRSSSAYTSRTTSDNDFQEEVQTPFTVDVYPNPTSDRLNVQFSLQQSEIVSIRIIDLMGRTIRLESVPGEAESVNVYHLNTDDLENGLYFIEVSNEREKQIHKVQIIR